MSAQAVSGQIQTSAAMTNTLTGTAGTSKTQVNVGVSQVQISAGTGAGQANEMWSETLTFTADTPVDLDLTALTGEGGRDVSFAAIKYLQVINADSVVGHDVLVGDSGTDDWSAPWSSATNKETVPSGGGAKTQAGNVVGNSMVKENWTAAGWTVDSTHKILRLDPGSHTVGPVTVLIIGNSAP
jgi:hypothetical protein